jgi:hypothetical protein
MNHPAQLSPLERYAEALVMFENFDRYRVQSAHTGVADPAPLPPRAPLLPIFTNPRNEA